MVIILQHSLYLRIGSPYINIFSQHWMSKNRLAIINFFRYYRPENETHELAISQFCAKRRFSLSIDGNKDGRLPVTYDKFKQWFEEEAPERGDVVVLPDKGVTGIVELSGVDQRIRLYASLHEGELCTASREFDYKVLCQAQEEDRLKLQHALHDSGLSWNPWRSKIKKQEIPVENVQYQISMLDRKIGYGVFREIDAQGQIVMYCVKLEGEPVRYSLYEVIGSQRDYQLDKINVSQREKLSEELAVAGVAWNGFFKRIEPVGYVGDPGSEYYYLNEFWEVCKSREQGKTKSIRYFNQGNYFRERKSIDALKGYLLKVLDDRLVERVAEKEYYYLKEFWKVHKTLDKGRSKDLKRAKHRNYFQTEEEAQGIVSLLQQKRNEQLSQYSKKM